MARSLPRRPTCCSARRTIRSFSPALCGSWLPDRGRCASSAEANRAGTTRGPGSRRRDPRQGDAVRARPCFFVMMLVLSLGIVSIVGAGAREGQLAPGAAPDDRSKRRARILMGHRRGPGRADPVGRRSLVDRRGQRLRGPHLQADRHVRDGRLGRPSGAPVSRIRNGWFAAVDDFLPDHGHLMHLYVIREPDFDHVWHLHPEMNRTGDVRPLRPGRGVGWRTGPGVKEAASSAVFIQNLPPMPAGTLQSSTATWCIAADSRKPWSPS